MWESNAGTVRGADAMLATSKRVGEALQALGANGVTLRRRVAQACGRKGEEAKRRGALEDENVRLLRVEPWIC